MWVWIPGTTSELVMWILRDTLDKHKDWWQIKASALILDSKLVDQQLHADMIWIVVYQRETLVKHFCHLPEKILSPQWSGWKHKDQNTLRRKKETYLIVYSCSTNLNKYLMGQVIVPSISMLRLVFTSFVRTTTGCMECNALNTLILTDDNVPLYVSWLPLGAPTSTRLTFSNQATRIPSDVTISWICRLLGFNCCGAAHATSISLWNIVFMRNSSTLSTTWLDSRQ